jgi:hypothetical protein
LTHPRINECKEYCTGIKVSGVRIQMLRFAVDVAFIVQDEINLKSALERLDNILKSNYKMKINRIKTITFLHQLMHYIYY